MKRRAYLLTAFMAWIAASGAAQARISIDLRAGTLNGRPVREWTLDQITDSLGRPSAVESGLGVVGPSISYHDHGIEFNFNMKSRDPAQHCSGIRVYLSRHWDKLNSQWFAIYSGGLAPAVSGAWKQGRLAKELADLSPVFERGVGTKLATITMPASDITKVIVAGLTISFLSEPNTTFLEQIGIYPKPE